MIRLLGIEIEEDQNSEIMCDNSVYSIISGPESSHVIVDVAGRKIHILLD